MRQAIPGSLLKYNKKRELMKNLDLHLKAEWYDMIESGGKTEEYREIKPYWLKRLFQCILPSHQEKIDYVYKFDHYEYKDFIKNSLRKGLLRVKPTHIRFHYGYTKRTMLREIKGVTTGLGELKWGAPFGRECFIISLKK